MHVIMINECQELEIPVPWGHIAGKVWGNPKGQRLLLVHGRQDNCRVFDRLVPLLKGDYYTIVIDLPGHGRSSQFPDGIPIDFLNYILAIYCVVEYVHWSKILFLGHSLGGQIGLFFASIFGEYIEKLIVIDHVGPSKPLAVTLPQVLRKWVINFVKLEKKLKSGISPVYSYQEALDKMVNRQSVLTTEAAEIVLERSLKKVPNGYNFVMDQRIKLNSAPLITEDVLKAIISDISCPILCIFSTERYQIYQEVFKDVFEILRKKVDYKEKVVQGKSWGRSSAEKKLLLVHGILHNCGSFNRLIPLIQITNSYCVVAIDLPGHGLSSHFPLGFPVDFYHFVHSIKRVIDFLKWERFTYLGHSYGGAIGTYFTSLFSDYVETLIIIDTMEPRPVPLNETLSHLQMVSSQFYELDKKLAERPAPVYSYEEVFNKTKQNRFWPLNDQATKDLLERSVKSFRNGYCFVNDQRLKLFARPLLTFDQQRVMMDNIICPVLFILADKNMDRYETYLKEVYDYNQSKLSCKIVQVEGDHAVHQNFPERVSSHINEFLSHTL